ncbi:fumarylacetoacetate hydrolase family protein [Bradyrhizobium liaoningense]|uniref:fumarylacetoacetate hydrolase family protein n=1 Tax=Bradyrhizobium liaoningense TaxID=43992 RepID=UPI001BA521A9|nr:fumarylacetoacetate hydrolase family protein [Bradyrhizobium liaoningense]MBR0840377.1 fumarylacetoacetate hydrolase family protein [Bradyrhizobium liaoningense]
MKLLSFRVNGHDSFGAIVNGKVIDLKEQMNGKYSDLLAVIQAGALPEVERALSGKAKTTYAPDEIEYLPVITKPPKILCIGINYKTHAEETGKNDPAHPFVFARFANTQIGHDVPMILPPESVRFDYEGEIAVIIGKGGRRISKADSWSHIAGYAPYNDSSIRDWQAHSTQWTAGKNFHATGAFGPYMATRGEITDNQELHLVTRLNGVEMQRATSHQMIFPIPHLIEYCSTFTALEPGDVIVSGAPGGVGLKRTPPVFMKDGDIVEVEIEGVATLRNPIKAE